MALLPEYETAQIDDRKITSYLLSRTHPDGAAKSAFFESFGFSISDPSGLRNAIVDHVRRNDVTGVRDTAYGQIYEVNGRIRSPDGRNPYVLIVWFVERGTIAPRLVTVVPSSEEKAT